MIISFFYMIISLILELRKPGYPADFYRKLALKNKATNNFWMFYYF